MTIAYSQRDIEWADDRLGTSKEYTMGTAGCLVSSVASVLSDLIGSPITPGHLNQWLRENKGYASGCLFVFGSVASFGVRLAELVHCQTKAAPIEHLSEVLADGAGVIVQVDSRPGGDVDQHWVRVLSVDEKDAQIMDPWQLPGGEFTKLSRYFAQGWTAERAIFTVAVYQAATPGRDIPDAETGGEHQEAICLRTGPARARRPRKRRAKLAKTGS